MHATPSRPTTLPASPTAAPPRRRVVDAPMRMFHALFALCFVGAYASADSEHWRLLHVSLGYTLAGLLGFRVVYGLIGPRPARLSSLARRLAGLGPWLRGLRRRDPAAASAGKSAAPLAMAALMVSLLVIAVPLTLSGFASYQSWGDVVGGDAWEELHEALGTAMLALVLGHVGLLALLSLLRGQNLARPMLSGLVDGRGPDLVRDNRRGLAAALLLGVLAFGAWQWQQAPAAGDGTAAGGPAAMRSEDDED